MKKLVSWFCIIFIMFSLIGCGKNKDNISNLDLEDLKTSDNSNIRAEVKDYGEGNFGILAKLYRQKEDIDTSTNELICEEYIRLKKLDLNDDEKKVVENTFEAGSNYTLYKSSGKNEKALKSFEMNMQQLYESLYK